MLNKVADSRESSSLSDLSHPTHTFNVVLLLCYCLIA